VTDVFSREKRSEIMRKIRSKNTKPEREFQKRHPEAVRGDWLPHSPDFLLGGRPVYLDSGFWHGLVPRRRFERLPKYWREKLFRNAVRDWCALAFWGCAGGCVRLGRLTWQRILDGES